MTKQLLQCLHVTKTYHEGPNPVHVLHDINLTLSVGEQVAILGSSGSGKSTLLHLLGALDQPDQGEVMFLGQNIFAFSERQQADFRNQQLGFVYQQHHLLPEFSALENTAMPLLIAGKNKNTAFQAASEMLKRVGLDSRKDHKPSALSGGERQRVAIARALVAQPKLVLADEPTGNLDDKTGDAIYELLLALKQELATSFVVVTHDTRLAAKLDRTLQLQNGRLVNDLDRESEDKGETLPTAARLTP